MDGASNLIDELVGLFWRYAPNFVDGGKVTLQLTMIGLALGIATGLPTAILRVYGGTLGKKLALAYIEIFRGTPLLVQIFIVYYGLPQYGIVLSQTTSAILALGLNSGAYQAEYFRGSIQAIGSGQMMAARAVGMSEFQALGNIILPQAFRLVIPAWSNEVIDLLKGTAVVFVIAVPDLMTEAKLIAGWYYTPVESYIAVAIAYLILVGILSVILHAVERRLKIPGLEVDVVKR